MHIRYRLICARVNHFQSRSPAIISMAKSTHNFHSLKARTQFILRGRNLIAGCHHINTLYDGLLVVYGLHTRGFSFDRPLGLSPHALSKLANRVYTTCRPSAAIVKHILIHPMYNYIICTRSSLFASLPSLRIFHMVQFKIYF